MENSKDIFIRIIKATFRNIIVFSFATAAIAHIASFPALKNIALLFAALEAFIIFLTLGALIYFIYYTINTYSTLRQNKPEYASNQMYVYTMAAFLFRLLEVAVYVYIIIFLYNLFLS